MMEAQSLFRRVVKAELQLLLDQSIPRDLAVKNLLQRIVKSATDPSESEVRKVMYQFQINRDDAVRALIVKQELGRLKQRGLNSFAAINELTLKMQLLLPLSPMSNRDTDDEAPEHVVPSIQDAATATPSSTAIDVANPSVLSDAPHHPTTTDTSPIKPKRKRKAMDLLTSPSHGLATSAASSSQEEPRVPSPPPVLAELDDVNAAALSKEVSLCQRIGNCSISSSPVATPDASSQSLVSVPKSSRKRRKVEGGDKASVMGDKSRYGTKKKLHLDVDHKFKAQFHDNFVKLTSNPPNKSSKRAWAKSSSSSDATTIENDSIMDDAATTPRYNPKKHRTD
ncbi:hypothetical protein B5M09_001632 [Aphanomyces astaci]|nr:hypothetical protein B5M09_001632 [Aphanomyces astaci]